jgi:hypothetical protein
MCEWLMPTTPKRRRGAEAAKGEGKIVKVASPTAADADDLRKSLLFEAVTVLGAVFRSIFLRGPVAFRAEKLHSSGHLVK